MKVFFYDFIEEHCSENININNYKAEGLNNVFIKSIVLDENNTVEIAHENIEMAIIILSGEIIVNDINYKVSHHLKRKSVFNEKATCVFIPHFEKMLVKANKKSQFIVCGAISDRVKRSRSLYISSNDVISKSVGRDNYSRRVDSIIGEDFPAQRILMGETFNEPGSWSSFPPHKHDVEIKEKESCHEEVYFFKIKNEGGFGFQRIYSKDKSIDESFTVKDNCLSIIPKGYHPVVASPGTELYYFWILSGKNRKLLMNTDPELQHLL
jgi:5-deoxy-glucuronate isomerase